MSQSKTWGNLTSDLLAEIKSKASAGVMQFDELRDSFVDPLVLLEKYVAPDLGVFASEESFNTESPDRFRSPAFKSLEIFLEGSRRHGGNQMLIAGDKGAGKTSLLAMIKIFHLTSLWPSGLDCVLLKSDRNLGKKIVDVQQPMRTVLLIDGIGEDREMDKTFNRLLKEVLDATMLFHRVLITCDSDRLRDWFRSSHSGAAGVLGLVTTGWPVSYFSLLPLDRSQMVHYFRKRSSGDNLLTRNPARAMSAEQIVDELSLVDCKPAYLERIVDSIELESLHGKADESLLESLVPHLVADISNSIERIELNLSSAGRTLERINKRLES